MKIKRFNKLQFTPASHEDLNNPGVWKKILLGKEELAYGRLQMINWAKLPVGKSFRAHYHEDMEEIFIMVAGTTEINIDNEKNILKRGDAVIIQGKKVHTMKNIGNEDIE
ncbi:cupin domain-containing protein [Candidatus Gottesmanbacteria bacterium]|nr:cupin domain-containing protein [Candidatus Gottesmanbacteria bacterium]